MKSYACASALMACLWLTPGFALADAKADAEKQFRAGVSLQKVEDFEAAISAFEGSLRLYPTKGAWFNLANCLRATHRYPEALTALERLQRDFGSELQDPMRSTVEVQVAELKNLTATLSVDVDRPGAEIAIDGRPVGTSPLPEPIRLGLGDHEVRATLAEFEPAVVRVNLGPAQTATAKISLSALGAAPRPAVPPAEVPAPAPVSSPPPPPAPAPPPPKPAVSESGSGGLRTAGMIGVGAGALLMAGGAVTGIWALSVDDDLDADCPDGHCAKDRAEDIDRLERLTTTTNVLLGAGAAVGLAGLALWLLDDSSNAATARAAPKAPSSDVALMLRPGFVGANLSSRF